MKVYEIYTDGSYCKDNGYGDMVHGGIAFWNAENGSVERAIHVQSADKCLVAGWSNGGECLAAYLGVLYKVADLLETEEYEQEDCLIRLVCDYEGVKKWMTGEWVKHDKPSSSWYYENMTGIIEYVKTITDKIKVEFVWVKGHADTAGNNVADEVAAYDLSCIHFYGAEVVTWKDGEVVE